MFENWKLLFANHLNGVEIWENLNHYLVCRKYERKFKFFKHMEDAFNFYKNGEFETEGIER